MDKQLRDQLLNTAKDSINFGLEENVALPISLNRFDPILQQKRATFVTLHLDGALRGCIGTLEAYQPLIVDVADNAFNAAFRDTRFSAVTCKEVPKLHYHISILTPSSPIHFTSEDDLLRQIRPKIDGLIIQDGPRRGTFLPSVWEQLPDTKSFFTHLKLKAGLSPNHWSKQLTVERYEVDSFGN